MDNENKDGLQETEPKNGLPDKSEKKKELDKKKLIYLFATVALSAFLCAFYYFSIEFTARNFETPIFFQIVMFSYMAILTVLVLVYIIYNRAFSRKGVTEDMLPSELSQERKREFIENGEKRLQRSKWVLVFIISFFFTFAVEAFNLFVLPMIRDLF